MPDQLAQLQVELLSLDRAGWKSELAVIEAGLRLDQVIVVIALATEGRSMRGGRSLKTWSQSMSCSAASSSSVLRPEAYSPPMIEPMLVPAM
jgi:hypothetical protein